ncbi:TatD family hydrolase [Clostridium sp. VAP23]|uniref:TatD family hydrolase n=1 Tax=Clostridium sp. VAP23 TaxID=2949981 RepID=UPI0020796B2C|nr:TatD family hydrolase [Clostridium sp. VAP23]
MNNLIDTHFHLDYYKNHKEIYEQINKLEQYTLCVTNLPEVFESCVDIYKQTKYLKFAMGYNPQMIIGRKFNKKSFLRNINKTKYIGEVGLDFSKRFYNYKDEQIDAFKYICELSVRKNKILSVHSRGAEKEVFEIMKSERIKDAIIHWYTGDMKIAEKFLEEGYYFSINPNMLNSKKGIEIIKNIPKDKILIESDGPFGKLDKNLIYPKHIKQVYYKFNLFLHIDDKFEELILKNFKILLYNNKGRIK